MVKLNYLVFVDKINKSFDILYVKIMIKKIIEPF